MTNKDDFFTTSDMHGGPDRPGKAPAPAGGAPFDEDEKPTPGYMREDASAWDRLSDGKRKLIAFGVLFGIILLMVLLIALGSSCGACDSCGTCSVCGGSTASGSDVSPSDADRLTDDISVPAVPDDETLSDADITPDEPSEEPAEDSASGTDVSSGDISGDMDIIADEDAEYVEVTRPGGFSACSHEADNEAGDGSGSTGGGFLGFLFGCTGCSEGCNLDVSDSLTDRPDSDDPTRLEGSALSGSDAQNSGWEAQPDDAAYLELLRTQLAEISDYFIQLNGLDQALAQYTDPQRVRDNDRFRKLTDNMLQWCDAAEGYDASLLLGDQALICNQLSVRLAIDLRRYIEDYPLLITGATSGTDVVAQGDQINAVMGDIVELYTALNPSPNPTAAPGEEITE